MAKENLPIILPTSGPVIQFDIRTGSSRRGPDMPLLEISASGDVRFWQTAETDPRIAKISQEQLTGLLHIIVNENRFFAIDSADIEQHITRIVRESGRQLFVADDGVVHISVTLDAQSKSISLYALSMKADLYPEIQELQDFNASANRLIQILKRFRQLEK